MSKRHLPPTTKSASLKALMDSLQSIGIVLFTEHFLSVEVCVYCLLSIAYFWVSATKK